MATIRTEIKGYGAKLKIGNHRSRASFRFDRRKAARRYGAIEGARPGGFALPSYTTTGDTTRMI